MKSKTLYLYFSILIIFLTIKQINLQDFDELGNYERYGYPEDSNSLSVVSISYELTYDETSVVKVTIKTYYEISQNIKFKAFLKTDDELHEHLLE